NGGPVQDVPGSPFTEDVWIDASVLGTVQPTDEVALHWRIIGGLEPLSEPFSAQVVTTINTATPVAPYNTFQNCSDVSTSTTGETIESCSTVSIIGERAIPRLTKQGESGAKLPNDVV